MIQFDLRKGISLANPQRMCRHLLLPHVCVKLHMVFSPQPAPACKETQPVIYNNLCIRPVLHHYMIQCESKERSERLFRFRMCPYSTSSCCNLSGAWIVTGHLVVGQHQGCQGTWTVARRRCFQQFWRVSFGYFFAKMLTNVCSMYMYVQV